MRIVIIGLAYTSSWGNGHATTYRGLIRALAARGHEVLFLERDVPWYASHRDAPQAPPPSKVVLYSDFDELRRRYHSAISEADAVIVGSYVPDGIQIGSWVLTIANGAIAFYDIDTPVTLAALRRGDCAYLTPELLSAYPLYLSFTGGPILRLLEKEWGSPMARALYCSVDPKHYYPESRRKEWDLGYLGTYSIDRQPTLETLLVKPARTLPDSRFVVAGAMYPENVRWAENIRRFDHLAPDQHRVFYNEQRFTLNVTRADMIAAGYSPSVRLFEAAACGTPIISDRWPGLEEFFKPRTEMFVASTTDEVVGILRDVDPRTARQIGQAARARVLSAHTAAHRATELENYLHVCRFGASLASQTTPST